MNEEVLQVYSVCMRIYAPKQFQEVDLKNPKATRLSSLKTQKEKIKSEITRRAVRHTLGFLSLCSPHSIELE